MHLVKKDSSPASPRQVVNDVPCLTQLTPFREKLMTTGTRFHHVFVSIRSKFQVKISESHVQ